MALLSSRPGADLVLAPGAARAPLPDALLRVRAPREVRRWLLHDGSLTERIARACGAVTVVPTRQGLGRPTGVEARLLHVPADGGWWIREITLCADGVARLRARTLVPAASPVLRRRLRGLGATPLGRVLFAADRLRTGVHRGWRGFVRTDDGAWLRCTRYDVAGEAMLLLERPLPALLAATLDLVPSASRKSP